MTRRLPMLFGLTLLVSIASIAAAATASAAPALRLSTLTPDQVTPGKYMYTIVAVQNVGDEPLNGDLTVSYELPPAVPPSEPAVVTTNWAPQCQTVGQLYQCTGDASAIQSGTQIRLLMFSVVDPGAAGTLTGKVDVSGGGTSATLSEPFSLSVGPSGPFAIESFGVGIGDGPTVPATQAGSDPGEVTTEVGLLSEARSNFDQPSPQLSIIAPTESFRDVVAHVPPGLIGNPFATPLRCTLPQLTTQALPVQEPTCPFESQVGLVQLNAGDIVPLYNLEPPAGTPAAFGFFYNSVIVVLKARLRPSDNGVDIVTEKASSTIPIPKFSVTLWGNPSDPSHDHLRGFCLNLGYGYNPGMGDCSLKVRSNAAFLRTPTSCPGTPLPWGIEVDTYQHPGTFVNKETTTPAMEACQDVPFDPSLSLAPTQPGAHEPSGLDLGLSIPQDAGPDGISQADLRNVTLALPPGVAVNPAAADGLAACSDAQLRLGLEGPSECPDASKLGSLRLKTPLLDEDLEGSVFLRTQASQDPASGEMYRLAIELRSDQRGVDVKLPGRLVVDPSTGQLTTTFADLPQLPFESMQLHLDAGPRAPLTTPQACGDYSAQATLSGWNGKTVSAEPGFKVDRNCAAAPFAPGFQAGVANPVAGAFSPFSLRVTRDPGMPNLSRIDATLPAGELAKLAGVGICPDAAAATGACPASSRVGQVIAAVGEGPSPLYLPQAGKAPTAVYLAGPYKGAPYSILAAVPAQAGPFDLGTVAVRSALRIDPTSAQASVLSDVLPQIFGGIPVSYRDVRVQVDRPEFTINPTGCEPKSVTGNITPTTGQSAAVSDRFQLANCASLGFRPTLSLALRGKTGRSGHPALTAILRPRARDANSKTISVALPHSEFLAQSHIRTVCTRVQFAAAGGGGEACPAGSVYGKVTATSPLLDYPLEGNVYLRSSSHPLPDLVLALHGPPTQPIQVDAVGRIDSVNGGIRTTFATVPDAPLTKVVLRLPGGKKSLLENSTNLCRSTNKASVLMDAHNGKTADFAAPLQVKCGGKARKGKHRGKARFSPERGRG